MGRAVGSPAEYKTEGGYSGNHNSAFHPPSACSHHWTLWNGENIHTGTGSQTHTKTTGHKVSFPMQLLNFIFLFVKQIILLDEDVVMSQWFEQ